MFSNTSGDLTRIPCSAAVLKARIERRGSASATAQGHVTVSMAIAALVAVCSPDESEKINAPPASRRAAAVNNMLRVSSAVINFGGCVIEEVTALIIRSSREAPACVAESTTSGASILSAPARTGVPSSD
jgi:hypothetical protein